MHEKMLWYNDQIQYRFHDHIMEYDMKAASVSVSEYFHLLDPETITQLKLLPKEKREIRMGLLQRDDKEFSDRLLSSIREIRRKFLETNGLSESDVLSLHSDACIISSTKKIKSNIDGIEFKHKGTWTGYMKYDKIEMFYVDNTIEYKGIPKELVRQHTLGINQYLCTIFDMIDNYDTQVLKFMSKFQKNYLQDKLPDYYYITFGKYGKYKMDNLKLFSYVANVVLQEMKGW